MTERAPATAPPADHGLRLGDSPIGDALEDGWDHVRHVFASHIPHHHPASAETPAATPTITTGPPEDHVNLFDEIKTDIANVAAKAERLDGEAVARLDAIRATPEGAAAFDTLHAIVAAEVPPAVLATVGNILKALVPAQPAPAQEQAPAETPPQPAFAAGGQA